MTLPARSADCRYPSSLRSAVSCREARGFRPPPGLRHGFERHAANWAEAGVRPNDLRMHRTGPQRFAGISRCYRRLVVDLIGRDVASRLGDETDPASGAAKVVAVPGMFGALPGCRRIEAHAAPWVARSSLGCRLMPIDGVSEGISHAHKILTRRF